ncbi:GntR family transcriptional regulator [Bacteroides sp. 214]|uniref:CvfB family protein n=1 Tax=Bacteroides sp. 214 TaxID=2302935 RepID=UPI0013D0ECBC|nr:S1-like domain-containing RNA-binding protein [Bacteroides sp. 214]NDW12499.1 GntR family transcriptional regulator [Bacteroides sp. 214]
MGIELGRYNTLKVVKEVDFGMYLDGDEQGEILLPSRYVPEDCKVGDTLDVFLYLDSEERLIATTLHPDVQVGEFALLEVAWVNQHGAFMDWGLMKDLFVPFSEQKAKMQPGGRYMIHAHLDDESYRIVASAKVERYLSKEQPTYKQGEEVEILVWQRTDLGYKVIVENQFAGLVYANECYEEIEPGEKRKAYIKQIREDGKIDINLQKAGYERVEDFSKTLYDLLKERGGYCSLNDKSDADLIYQVFGVSKKTFKKAIGALYRQQLISIEPDGIRVLRKTK